MRFFSYNYISSGFIEVLMFFVYIYGPSNITAGKVNIWATLDLGLAVILTQDYGC